MRHSRFSTPTPPPRAPSRTGTLSLTSTGTTRSGKKEPQPLASPESEQSTEDAARLGPVGEWRHPQPEISNSPTAPGKLPAVSALSCISCPSVGLPPPTLSSAMTLGSAPRAFRHHGAHCLSVGSPPEVPCPVLYQYSAPVELA